MERQMVGQAKHNILGHADVLINDTHVFCECQYLYILRKKITITLTFIKTLGYRFHESRTTLKQTNAPILLWVIKASQYD